MMLWGSTSKRVLGLPNGISRGARMPIKIGRGCFWVRRQGDARNLFYNQKMRVSGHVLIVVTRGFLRLRVDDILLTVGKEQAVFLSDIDGEISELVDVGEGTAEFSWFLFNDALLAKMIPLADWPLKSFHQYAYHPCAQDVIGFSPDQVKRADSCCEGDPGKFIHRIFLGAYQSGVPSVIKLLVNRVMIPRFKIRLFIENMVFLNRARRRQCCERFPGGYRALKQGLSRLSFPPLEALVARRRRALRIAMSRIGHCVLKHESTGEEPLSGAAVSDTLPSFFPEVEGGDLTANPRESVEPTFTGVSNNDRSISGALPRDAKELKILQQIQREQVQELLSSKLMKLPGLENHAEALAAV